MCTAAVYTTKSGYFGRTLDYEFSYGEEVAAMPRRYALHFRHAGVLTEHYAILGMAHMAGGYPLYYDAMNEKGLGMAGLNFVGNAAYAKPVPGKDNVASFEFIPWILGQCADVPEARKALANLNLTDDSFAPGLPASGLHWMLSDGKETLVVESMADGLHIYDNPAGVLTNNPPFPMQLFNLNNYRHLSTEQPENQFSKDLDLQCYSRGLGALGLPGDLSSMSRFVRAAFVRANSRSGDGEAESVSQFFHILGSVDQQRGCCLVAPGKWEYTIYTACCSLSRGIYYYTTYDNHAITAIDLHKTDLNGDTVATYPLVTSEQIYQGN